ncbi:DUF1636 family protein [Albidovulum sp.]
MSGVVVWVCQSCQAGGRSGLARRLQAAFGTAAEVREGPCMSGCARPPTVAFRASGKTAYLFGGIEESDIAALALFLGLYRAAPDGNLADARPLGALRHKALARIPG